MHIVIAGNHPELSQAEILALDPKAAVRPVDKTISLVEFSGPAGEILPKTGGVIKAATHVLEIPNYDEASFAATLVEMLPAKKERVLFGISSYGGPTPDAVKKLGMHIKRLAEERGRRVRFVVDRSPALSAATILKNHLLQEGVEFVLVKTRAGIAIGESMFVQDIDNWSTRDYGRPARDAKSGMLPPKLARIMVNLAGSNTTGTLWDPFSGSGTVLTEAAMLGWKKIYASDIDEKALAATKKNLEWLEKTQRVSFDATVFPHDALQPLSAHTLPGEFTTVYDAIVAEGYLGPPLSKYPDRGILKAQEKTACELEMFYKKVRSNLLSHLKVGSVLVLAIPFFHTKTGDRFLQTGFTGDRWLYRRADQMVGREIWRMKKE